MKRINEWLDISTTGFRQRQEDRPPAHLLKEIVQNALDATEDMEGGVILVTIASGKSCVITVKDNGLGVSDFSALRTVFFSGKEDSYRLRGRLGQGVKEVLALAEQAEVLSRGKRALFHVVKDKRVMDIDKAETDSGTYIRFWMPWTSKNIVRDLTDYLNTFLVPLTPPRELWVNGQKVEPRKYFKRFDVELTTELFNESKWVRRTRPGQLELVKCKDGEKPYIYEMGIPVAPIDWNQPYHINVLMRVPMNPRRDAVAAGYMKDVYAILLPQLMDAMPAEEMRDEWVSTAVEKLEPELQKTIVVKAFGENAVRSVPSMGKHDFDSDARELGRDPIQSRLLPSGLRRAVETFLPTSKDIEMQRRQNIEAAAQTDVPKDPKAERARAVLQWLASESLGTIVEAKIVPEIDGPTGKAIAAWASGARLLLSNEFRGDWIDPFAARTLGLLVHEMAHEIAAHHGDDFKRAQEVVAGKLARLCLFRSEDIRQRFLNQEAGNA
jgi:hypothetical protein